MTTTWLAGLAFVLGTVCGTALAGCILRLSQTYSLRRDDPRHPARCPQCDGPYGWFTRLPIVGYVLTAGRCGQCGHARDMWPVLVELGTGLLFAAYVFAYLQFDCQGTPEVAPDPLWRYGRLVSHLVLFGLLIAATGIDFREYVIPDVVVLSGIGIGLLVATVSGDVQIIHLWVDWNRPDVELIGPHIPDWIKEHRHWHGLAWSAAGLLAGGGITWLVRAVSAAVLGHEALGFGDVTLMAMIGCFLGWQPVLFVFLLAPFCGILIGVAVKLARNQPYVPYGPFLSAAAVVVLFGWKWLWLWEPSHAFSIRRLFGDAASLAILSTTAIVALGLLLGLLRLYRMIPGKRRDEP